MIQLVQATVRIDLVNGKPVSYECTEKPLEKVTAAEFISLHQSMRLTQTKGDHTNGQHRQGQ